MTPITEPQGLTWQVSPDLLGIVNQSGVFVETNPAWQTVLGWSQATIRTKAFSDFLHPDDVDRTLALFSKMKAGEPALHFENRYQCKDGSYRWLSWVAVPEGDIFVCSARDVSEDKARERALKSAADEALLREQFIAILGHDLRNPLAAIGAATRIAARQPHNEKIAEMLHSVDGSAARMANLIETIMDFARARLGGGIPVDLKMVTDLRDGFERVIGEIRLAYPERSIETLLEFDGSLVCDVDRLGQLLSNLVANAVTHGSVSKSIVVETKALNGNFVLSVTNAGAKISDHIIPSLFMPFERAEQRASLQGLGLGLYIADQIAKAHSGKISATSDDVLTIFRLEVPLEQEHRLSLTTQH